MSSRPWVIKEFPVQWPDLTACMVHFYESFISLLSSLSSLRFPSTNTSPHFYNKNLYYTFNDCSRPLLTKVRIVLLHLDKQKSTSECSDVSESLSTNFVHFTARLWGCSLVSLSVSILNEEQSQLVSKKSNKAMSLNEMMEKVEWFLFVK